MSQGCDCWCPPFSAHHVAFLFICLPGPSLPCLCPPFSAGHVAFLFICLFRWPCTAGVAPGHVAFLFICLPSLSLRVSALFRWPCSISIHLSPKSVTAGPPFSVGHADFYSFVSQVCHCWCPPFSIGCMSIHLSPTSVTAAVRPFPLAM